MTPANQQSDDLVPASGRQLATVGATPGNVPVIFLRSEQSSKRFWEFFTVNIRNRNTRRAYFVAISQFSNWCDERKLALGQVEPLHVAAYIELLGLQHSKPTVKQHLAAIRMLFDWLVTGQVMPTNPALRSGPATQCQKRKDISVVRRGNGRTPFEH